MIIAQAGFLLLLCYFARRRTALSRRFSSRLRRGFGAGNLDQAVERLAGEERAAHGGARLLVFEQVADHVRLLIRDGGDHALDLGIYIRFIHGYILGFGELTDYQGAA